LLIALGATPAAAAECPGNPVLHDTRTSTAARLPEFLRALKRRGYAVVHVVPAGGRPAGSRVKHAA
jgi:hypothetical protein